MIKHNRRALALLMSSAALLTPGAVQAQEASDTAATLMLQEIVVTANRRAENIQSVPTAITALGGEALREQNISSPQDLLGKVPAVMVTSNGTTRNAETVIIRGQGQTYLAPVGVVNYFAEVPLIQGSVISNQGGPGTFFDLQSLEVLRGPQGTLFGKNTTGGAVLLGPAKPKDRFEGHVQAQFGNYNNREFEGVLNVPFDETLAVRLAFKTVDRDGFTKDVGPGPFGYVLTENGPAAGFAGKDYDDKHYDTVRLGVLWNPTERFENYLVAYYTKSHDNGSGLSLSDMRAGGTLSAMAGNLFYRQPTDPLYGSMDPTIAQSILAWQQGLGPRKTALNTDLFSEMEVWSATNTLSAQLTDELTFRGIVGYQRMKHRYAWDLDGSILPLASQITPLVVAGAPGSFGKAGERTSFTDLSQISVEPQIQGGFLDGNLVTVIGAFYSKVQPEGPQAQGSFNFGTPGIILFDVETKSKALYGQSDLDLGVLAPGLNGLKLTTGIRQTWDSYDASRYAPTYFNVPTANAADKNSATTWTVGLNYPITDGSLLFGKISRGYKAGGFNMAGVRQEGLTYGPEYVTNYEIGSKSDFHLGDAPARLNIAAYHLDYDGIQRAGNDNAFNNFQNAAGLDQGARTFNAGTARIRGIEVEASVMPVEGLEFSGSYALADGKYKTFLIDVPPDPLVTTKDSCTGVLPVPSPYLPGAAAIKADLSCIPFPFLPKNQFSLNARYEHALPGTAGTLVGIAGYSWVDRQYSTSVSTEAGEPRAWLDSYGVLNLSVEWQDLLGYPVDLRAFATNLTNKTYRIGNSNLTDTAFGSSASTYGEPRMYGMSIRYRFGD